MKDLLKILKDSFVVLKKEPKLFFPKIFLSLLWGFILLYSMNLLVKMQEITLIESVELKAVLLEEIFPAAIFLLFLSFFFFLIDSVINSAYPLMIQKYLKKQKFSVLNCIKQVLQNFFRIILPVLIAFFISFLILIPFTVFFSFSFVSGDSFLTLISGLVILLIVFLVTVLFYFIYPVAVIEKKGLASVFSTVRKSFSNTKEASFGTFIALILSLFSAFIASFSETAEITVLALIVFVLLRIITAVLATYAMVLNPMLYFKK